MESRWTFKTLESNFRGQNSMPCGIFISLKSSWNLDVKNWFALFIQTSKTQVMAKRRAIDNMPHAFKKLSKRATTLLQITPRSEVCSQSYGAPKSWESSLAQALTSFTHSHGPAQIKHNDAPPSSLLNPKRVQLC
jgi:hypothetical protein